MYALLCVLGPSVIGAKISNILVKKEQLKDIILNYLVFVCLSNTFVFGAFKAMGRVSEHMATHLADHSFAFRYIVSSIFVNILLGIITAFVETVIDVRLEKKEKNEKKKK